MTGVQTCALPIWGHHGRKYKLPEEEKVDELACGFRSFLKVESRLLGPREVYEHSKQTLLDQHLKEGSWHAKIDEEFALQHGVFAEIHHARSSRFTPRWPVARLPSYSIAMLPRALLGNVSGGLCACVHFFVSKQVPQWIARQV